MKPKKAPKGVGFGLVALFAGCVLTSVGPSSDAGADAALEAAPDVGADVTSEVGTPDAADAPEATLDAPPEAQPDALDTGPDVDSGSTVGAVASVVGADNRTPVAGATVCVYRRTDLPCAVSDALGVARLQVPADAETGLQVAKAGYTALLVPIDTHGVAASFQVGGLVVLSNLEVALLAAAVGTSPDPASGVLFFAVKDRSLGAGTPGATAAITVGSGVGPFYFDYAPGGFSIRGEPQTGAPGSGFFHHVAGPVAEVTFGGGPPPPGGACPYQKEGVLGWPTGDTNRYRVPIEPGHISALVVRC